MRKLFQYGGIAASIVLIAFGIGAVYMGIDGRSQVRSDLAREQIVGTEDSTIPGQKVDTGSEAQAFAGSCASTRSRPPAARPTPRWAASSDANGKPTNDEKLAAINPADRQAGRERPAQHVGQRDRAHHRAQHRLLRREVATFAIVMGIALLLTGIGFASSPSGRSSRHRPQGGARPGHGCGAPPSAAPPCVRHPRPGRPAGAAAVCARSDSATRHPHPLVGASAVEPAGALEGSPWSSTSGIVAAARAVGGLEREPVQRWQRGGRLDIEATSVVE